MIHEKECRVSRRKYPAVSTSESEQRVPVCPVTLFTVPDRIEMIGIQKNDANRQPKEGFHPILCLKGLEGRNSKEQ
jgi:hypothetical protein